jgi:hypothetical protein
MGHRHMSNGDEGHIDVHEGAKGFPNSFKVFLHLAFWW